MKRQYSVALTLTLGVAMSGSIALSCAVAAAGAAEPQMSFKDDVLPIFKLYCASCHASPAGAGYKASGLDLTTYEAVMKGTKYGPMVVPGNPEYSNLMWLLDWRASPQLRMPHDKKQLPLQERNIIRAWIQQGAKDN